MLLTMAAKSSLDVTALYPVVSRFLLECGLNKSLKTFKKESEYDDTEAPVGKKAKKLARMELATACTVWLQAQKKCEDLMCVASDLYPAVRSYLTESELLKTLKAFEKEACLDDEEAPAGKKAKKLAKLQLTEACGQWLQAQKDGTSAKMSPKIAPKTSPKVSPKLAPVAGQKRAEPEPDEDEEPQKRTKAERLAIKEARANKQPGVPFKRVDDDAWRGTITDQRLMDNTHLAKAKFGKAAGDSWGDAAAEDMLKVKGKGFRKEMAKKKRASWRGGGALDQGINSIAFPDSDDN